MPPNGRPCPMIRLTVDDAMALRDAAILWLGNLERVTGRKDERIATALCAVDREIMATRARPQP